uniref:protocadherin-16-like n=1 Tax=Myxine glutinosa TaxID=7769 RepID=UPI00358E77BD
MGMIHWHGSSQSSFVKESLTRETVQYLLSEGDPEGVLTLDPISGMLRTMGRKPCCGMLESHIRVTAWVPGRPTSAWTTSVRLTVLRDNQPPRFPRTKGHVLLSQMSLRSDGLFYSARAQPQGRDSAKYIQYKMLRNPGGLFYVNAETGGVHLLKKHDVPDGRYEVLLEARDGRQPALATPLNLMVTKLPSSACDLHWPGLAPYRVRVSESVQPGTTILRLQVSGLCPGTQPYYHLLASPTTAKLRLGVWTGVLSVQAPLDHEKDSQLALTVQVHDGFGHDASLDLDVVVQDSNDNKPIILDGVGPHLFSVPENGPIGLPVGRVKAYDPDAGHNGQLRFSLRSQPESPFYINPNTGELVTTQSLNRESCTFYRLIAVVSDLGSPMFSATATLLVEVLDENDNPPNFYPGQDTLEVLDVSPPGTWLATRSAFDPDAGNNGTFSFSLLPSDGSEQYLLDSQTGELRTAETLTRSSYSLRLEVHDGGTPPLRTEALLQIKVIVTSNYKKSPVLPVLLTCPPLTSPGTGIGTLPLPEGWSPEPGRVNFTLMGGPGTGHFVVERTSGKVCLSSLAPVSGRYHLDVWLEGVIESEKPQESYVVASVAVLPAASLGTIRLDWPNNGPLELMVSEEVPLGQLIHTFSALPADYSIRYGLLGNPVLPLAIDAASGELRTTDLLDREETSSFDFVVTAELITKGYETFLPVKLHISDVNDNAPYWRSQAGVTRKSWIGDRRRENWRSQNVEVLEDEQPGSPLACLVAYDPDTGESGHVSYALTEGNEENTFSVDENFGLLYLSKLLDRERHDSYQLVLSATDKGTPPQTAYLPVEVLVLDINEPPEFTSGIIKASVVENCLPRCFVTQLQAQDLDLGMF